MIESPPLVESVTIQSPIESKGSFSDYLANERTFLAWIRTSLGIFAFGCVIVRFGGSNNMQTTLNHTFHEMKPMISGLVLIACGTITLFYSIHRYYRINRQISEKDLIYVSQIRQPIIITFVLLVSMIVLVIIFIIL
jgi:putative membrane protein